MAVHFFAFKFFIILYSASISMAASPIVKIGNGSLEGSLMKSRNGREFTAFRGIPFALPPVDELRFAAPKPAADWTGVRSAKEDGKICIQIDFATGSLQGSEDCLFLNVYTPKLPTKDDRTSYPVMIVIHGGAWTGGSAHSEFLSPIYFLDYDVVLVAVNYRLGPLGFLSTEDMVSPGNYGLKDQSLSIKWVNENIAEFGGDPKRITIFGCSSGGVSVHYHIISPLSKGLFHRAISQSGSSMCPWTLRRPKTARKHAERLGEHFNCSISSSEELVTCLRKQAAADIVQLPPIFTKFGIDPIVPFRAVIEPNHQNAFLTEEPSEAFMNGNVNDVPWMAGINSHEGSLRVTNLFSANEKDSIDKLNNEWFKLAPISLLLEDIFPQQNYQEIAAKIREYYLGSGSIDMSLKSNLIEMYGDAWFNLGIHKSVKHHHQVLSSPVYYYYFSYKGKIYLTQSFKIEEDYGVSHGEDLIFFFPLSPRTSDLQFNQSEDDDNMITLLTNMWYNFANTGNPTPEVTKTIPIKWEPVKTDALEYLAITDSKNLTMLKNLNSKRMAFWESLHIPMNTVQPAKSVRDEL